MTVEIDGANNIIKTNTINEVSSANGVTVDGLSIKDSKLVTANSVIQTNITDQAINEAKMQISNAPTNGYALTAQSSNTGGMTWASVGETNSPSFLTTLSGVQSIANTTDVTVGFNSTTNGFDTDSGFNTGTHTYTIPSGKGGKYYMYAGFFLNCAVADKMWSVKFVTTQGQRGELYGNSNSADGVTARCHMIHNFSAGNTVFVRIYHNFGGAKNTASGIQGTYFGGFRIAT